MTLHFSGILLRLVNYQRTLPIEADSLGDALERLEERHPQVRKVLRDGSGQIRRTHQVFLNGEQLTDPALDTPLKETDRVEFLTAIAGG
ncbi:MoaD/ThiS family protein [Streptomyces sp. A1-5]|uniref:MoaD/ThiS family protein n=1 Tax=Streptomyces sp. A1-5 TaxID=2738410 RepID=UPI001F448DFC|nr:MoaD/ThiS family protein [Streptomyces sp. A1-5]UJB43040.1 MoaD/ThiS family protein [Streptomyces sp. A1-5]